MPNIKRIMKMLLLGLCFLYMIGRFNECFINSLGKLMLSFSSSDRIELYRRSAFSLSCLSHCLRLRKIGNLLKDR